MDAMQIVRQRLKGLPKESTALGSRWATGRQRRVMRVTGVLLAVGLVLLPAVTSAEQRNVVPDPQDFVPSRGEFTPSVLLLEFDEDSYCEYEESDRDSGRVTRNRNIWRYGGYVDNLHLVDNDRADASDATVMDDWCRGVLIDYGQCESDTGNSVVFTIAQLSRAEVFYRLTFEDANSGIWSVSSVSAGVSYSNLCSGSGSFRWMPGAPRAQYELGFRYATGRGVQRDDAEALRWFRRAAEQEDASAQTYLGFMYVNGRGGVQQDDAEALRWFRRAAEQEDASAQTYLGFMYVNGRGVQQDDAEALRWFRQAAEQGNPTAQTNLGVMYENGRGVQQDDAEALRWFPTSRRTGKPHRPSQPRRHVRERSRGAS